VPAEVRAAQIGGSARNTIGSGSDDAPNLLDMDPIEFELLVGQLLTAMGWTVTTTERSGDGGIDLIANDPHPFTGGTVLVQVKRYRNTVPPDVIRDMFGTLHHVGAGRGLVVTTSSFGPAAHAFVENKPLSLIEGDELVYLLNLHGLPGRIDW
jgi:restriction system protein